MRKQKAFTLVELMVVIVIIGLLSSIILVSLKSAREKARIAKGLQFSSSVHHALGAYAVGIWDFDLQTADDSSGYNNHGTIYGATFTTDTPSEKGYALSFDGNDDYVDCGNSLSLNNAEGITLSAWIYSSAWASWRAVIYAGSTDWNLQVSSSGLTRFAIENTVCIDSSQALSLNKWIHLVTTWDGTDSKLYIDGVEESSTTACLGLTINDTGNAKNIGRYSGGSQYFNGLIDDVRIYEEALSSAQIRKLYVEGAREKGLAIENDK